MGLKDFERMTEWHLMEKLKYIKRVAEDDYLRKLEFWSTWNSSEEFIVWVIPGVEGWEIKSDLITN